MPQSSADFDRLVKELVEKESIHPFNNICVSQTKGS
jgi:hypothetical protein